MGQDTKCSWSNQEFGVGGEEGEVECERVPKLVAYALELDRRYITRRPCAHPKIVELSVMEGEDRVDEVPFTGIW